MTEPETKQSARRTDWKERQARARRAGIIKTVLGVIFVGVLVGLGIVYKDQLLALLEKKPAAVAVKPPPPPAAVAPPVDRGLQTPPPASIPKPPPAAVQPAKAPPATEIISAAEETAAMKLIQDGCAALEQFKFDEARVLFTDAAAKKCGSKMRAEAKTWSAKAVSFKEATRHIRVADFATAPVSYVMLMQNGSEFVGLKLSETQESVSFQCINRANPAADGKTTLPLPRSDIEKETAVTLPERREQFLQLLGALERSVADSVQASTDYYDLVYLSRRLNLGHECIAYLNRACDGGSNHRPDPYLGDSFKKEVVRRAIERASLMLAAGRSKTSVTFVLNDMKKTLPGYAYAADEAEAFTVKWLNTMRSDFKSTLTLKETKPVSVAVAAPPAANLAGAGTRETAKTAPPPPVQSARELARVASNEESVEVVIDDTSLQASGAAGDVLKKANARYDEGLKWYRQFRQGANGNNKVLKSALVCLEDAMNLYDEVLAKDPNNKAVQDRQTEASMIMYGCKKYQTL